MIGRGSAWGVVCKFLRQGRVVAGLASSWRWQHHGSGCSVGMAVMAAMVWGRQEGRLQPFDPLPVVVQLAGA